MQDFTSTSQQQSTDSDYSWPSTGPAATLPVVEHPARFRPVMYGGKAWLTAEAALAPRGEFEELTIRGYTRHSAIANAAVWDYLDVFERNEVFMRMTRDKGADLHEAIESARLTVESFLQVCADERLHPNLEKLSVTWSRGTLNLDRLAEALAMSLESLRVNKSRKEMAAKVKGMVNLEEYPDSFPARNRARRLIAVLGPTNSGKTYDAFHRLSTAQSGAYLGPLRLLALEAFNRLNDEFGVKTSLITGEERREVEDSKVTASTIEMLDTVRDLDVAVIDEIQMLNDPERGWAWTQAVIGANADEVWLLGSLSAEPAVRALAARLGLPLEVRKKLRKNPLKVSNLPMGSNPRAALAQTTEGDALIVFSRRDALNLRDDLIQRGFSVACIYGALSPEVREREAQRFASGEAHVLVATDAIGMGLNLGPLRRVIFTCVKKYDGTERIELCVPLLQQIGGRAGRYGHQEEDGIVCGLTPNEHRVVQRLMKAKQEPLPTSGFQIGAGTAYLNKIAETVDDDRLEVLLTLFVTHAGRGDGFFIPHVPQEQMDRAATLDEMPEMALDMKNIFAQAPMSSNNAIVDATWRTWARSAARGKQIRLSLQNEPSTANLEDGETAVHLITAYRWFAYRLPEIFIDLDQAADLLEPWVEAVDEHLRSRRKQGVGGGKSGTPSWYWAN